MVLGRGAFSEERERVMDRVAISEMVNIREEDDLRRRMRLFGSELASKSQQVLEYLHKKERNALLHE